VRAFSLSKSVKFLKGEFIFAARAAAAAEMGHWPMRAFSSEVGAGSRQENASNKELELPF
jgi:hypothetical protein